MSMIQIELEYLAVEYIDPFVSEFPIIDLRRQVDAINSLIGIYNISVEEMLAWLDRYGTVRIDEARQSHYQAEFGTNIYRYKSLWGFTAIFYFDNNRQILFYTVVWR